MNEQSPSSHRQITSRSGRSRSVRRTQARAQQPPPRATTRVIRFGLLAITVLALLVGAGAALSPHVPVAVAVQDPTTCPANVALVNGGFELPNLPVSPPTAHFVADADGPGGPPNVAGWRTTASDNQMEIWNSGFSPGGVTFLAAEGDQFAELNAFEVSTLFQDLPTTPGQTISWRLAHRGRVSNTVPDVLDLRLGPPAGPLVAQTTASDTNTAWGRYNGTYTVPAGQTTTRFAFVSVSAAGGNQALGNLLDDVFFGTPPCNIVTKTVSPTGTVSAGTVLTYQVNVRNDGGDVSGATVLTDPIPAGTTYVPGSLRIVSGPNAGTKTDAAGDDQAEFDSDDGRVVFRLGNGANASVGGSLANSTTLPSGSTIEFQVRTSGIVPSVTNAASVSYQDLLTNPPTPLTSTSDDATSTVTPLPTGVPFACDGSGYLVQNTPSQVVRVVTSTTPYTFTPVGPVTAVQLNALGYRPTDNFLYAMDLTNNVLVRIDATGAVTPLGLPAGLPVAGYNVGAVSNDGATYYVTVTGSTTLYAVNLATLGATPITLSEAFGSADIAQNPVDGMLYAASDAGGVVQRINPATGAVTPITVPGLPAGTFGGTWFNADGVLVAYDNAGTLYQIQLTSTPSVLTSQPGPSTGNNDGAACAARPPAANLSITKTASPDPAVVGAPLTYTVTVFNAGPDTAAAPITVTDTLPAGATFQSATGTGWSCTFAAPTVTCTRSTLLPLGPAPAITITVTAPITGADVVNQASVTSSTPDPDPVDNTTTTTTPLTGTADLSITKTSSPNPYTPGGPLTYTVVVTNNGPSAVTGATVTDTVPAAVTGVTWTCTATSGSSCAAASGAGNSINTTVNLINGGSATYTITGTAPAGAIQTLTNTATVTTPTGVTDPDPSDNTSTNTNPTDPKADLRITKTSSPNPYTPGGPLTYTIVVTNAGPSNVTGAPVTDTIPAVVTGVTWTCAASSGSSCAAASGSGNAISTTVSLVVSGTATFTVTGTAPAGPVTPIVNTATVTVPTGTTDPNPNDNTATNTNPGQQRADLSLTKTSSPNPYVPGGTITYTIVATNSGPDPVTGATVTDTVPAAVTGVNWTCAASMGSSCPAGGTGNTLNTTVNLLSGGTATFTITGIAPSGPVQTLTNTATITTPPGVEDPDPTDNTDTETNPTDPRADLRIFKQSSPNPYVPGGAITYTISVQNLGPSDVAGATVTDTIPAAITGVTWTCAATAPNTCTPSSGSGNAVSVTVNLVNGGGAVITATGTAPAGPIQVLTNTARITSPPGNPDPNPGDNTSTNTNPGGPTASPVPSPTPPGQPRPTPAPTPNNSNVPTPSPRPPTPAPSPSPIPGVIIVPVFTPAPSARPATPAPTPAPTPPPSAAPDCTRQPDRGRGVDDRDLRMFEFGVARDACAGYIDAALELALSPLTAGGTATATLTITNAGLGHIQEPLTVAVALPAGLRLDTTAALNGWTCTQRDAIVLCSSVDMTDPTIRNQMLAAMTAGLIDPASPMFEITTNPVLRAQVLATPTLGVIDPVLPLLDLAERRQLILPLLVDTAAPGGVTVSARLLLPGDAVAPNDHARQTANVAGGSGPSVAPTLTAPWSTLLDPRATTRGAIGWLARGFNYQSARGGWTCDALAQTVACIPTAPGSTASSTDGADAALPERRRLVI